jgi:hypothetical protein
MAQADHEKPAFASQAGRPRRFDPGRPLYRKPLRNQGLSSFSGSSVKPERPALVLLDNRKRLKETKVFGLSEEPSLANRRHGSHETPRDFLVLDVQLARLDVACE